jgi:hypothetical protein
MENLGHLPAWITAGETIWISAANTTQGTDDDIVLDDYLPADYNLSYEFAAPTPITVAAVTNGAGTGWTLEVSAAQTLAWGNGSIPFLGKVTHKTSARVFAVDSGSIMVKASPLAVSQYAAALAAVDLAIAEYASNPYGSFALPGNMTVSYRSLDDLLSLRAFYRSEVARTSSQRMRRIIHTEFKCA